ncbi:Hypothetical predicted protein [Paramuricea clavata]|nr:Hypothetical predicted protein [Paramuricea clavata]
MPVSEERLEQIKKETAIDQTMKTLFSTIRRGWPETRKQTPCEIQDYWNYRAFRSRWNLVEARQDYHTPQYERKDARKNTRESHGHREIQTTSKGHYVLAKNE